MMSSEHIRVDLLSFRIDTPRLTLRPITQSDAGVIQVLADDAEIARNTLQIPHPYPPGEASKWIERAILAASAGKILTLVLTAKPATLADGIPVDTALGTLSLGFDWPNSRGELGYWLGTAYHGRGMMTEAVTALVRDSFDRLGLARVFAQVFSGNRASQRVLEKAGFRHEGTLRRHIRKDGAWKDLHVYGCLCDEWRVSKDKKLSV